MKEKRLRTFLGNLKFEYSLKSKHTLYVYKNIILQNMILTEKLTSSSNTFLKMMNQILIKVYCLFFITF